MAFTSPTGRRGHGRARGVGVTSNTADRASPAPQRPDREGRVAKFVIAKQAVGTRVRKRVSDYPPGPSSAKPAPATSIEANPLFFASEVGQVVEGKPCCTGELHRDPRDGWASVIEPPAYKEGVWFRVRRHDPAKLTVTGSK